MRQRIERRDLLTDAVRGAVAGVAATWVMGKVTTFLYEREDERAREAEDRARGGKTAYGVAAEKAAGLAGRELSDEERKKAGAAVHWALGASAGAVYGMMRDRAPGTDAGAGTLFGVAFWLAVDEGANAALGLTPGPRAFPWQAHARGLAGHLALGAATDLSLRLLDGVAA